MIEREKFKKAFYAMTLSKGRPYDIEMCEVFYMELKDESEEKVFKAMKDIIRLNDDFITVAKILALIKPAIDYNIRGDYLLNQRSKLTKSERILGDKIKSGMDSDYAQGYMQYGYAYDKLQREYKEMFIDELKRKVEAGEIDLHAEIDVRETELKKIEDEQAELKRKQIEMRKQQEAEMKTMTPEKMAASRARIHKMVEDVCNRP